MVATISIPKEEYTTLKLKADLFDHYVEVEELSSEELAKIKKALSGPLLSKSEFLKRNQDLS